MVHQPGPISITSLVDGNRLLTQTHSHADLSRVLIQYLNLQNSGRYTTRTEEALSAYQRRGVWPIVDPEDRSSMMRAFDILNDVFFNGCLTGKVELDMTKQPSDKPTQRGQSKLHLSRENPLVGRRSSRDLYCWIQVHPIRNGEDWQRAQTYQSVLVHEMIHAYFEIYACRCRDGCKDAAREWRGHMPDWFLAAKAIVESRVNQSGEIHTKHGPLSFNLKIRFDRILAKALYRKDGPHLPVPPREYLSPLGIDWKGVQVWLMRIERGE